MPPRRIESREIRDRRLVVARILELLPPALRAGQVDLRRGPERTWVLRSDRGQLIATFTDKAVAQFLLDAPEHLQRFCDYSEQLQLGIANAHQARAETEGRLQEVTDELLAADSVGPSTRDGQRRVRSAIESVKDRRRRQVRGSW